MEEKDIVFGSIISSPALNFFLHFRITVSEPLVLYELAKSNEKRMKKGNNRKSFDRTNQFKT
jgi:hypothetical protein